MGTIFANPLEELAEFQDMNKELNEGRAALPRKTSPIYGSRESRERSVWYSRGLWTTFM